MDTVLRIALPILIILIALILAALAVLSVTGGTDRAYAVVEPETIIQVGNEHIAAANLALRYQPITRLKTSNPSPPLLQTYFEIIENEKTWDVVYYNVWEDEINPNPFIHQLYRLFRAAYYGYPVRDIEYVQVNVEKQSGAITALQFETSPGEDYFVVVSVHWIARYTFAGGSKFDLILRDKNSGKQVGKEQGIEPWFEGTRPVIEVATWNHLSRLAVKQEKTESVMLDAPLVPLSAEEYRTQKFSRKSQGDYQTRENLFHRIISIGAILVLGTVTGVWLIWLLSKILNRPGKGGSDGA